PRELNKVCLPDYRVEPPDILIIEAVRTIPKPPYRAEPLDVLYLHLAVPLPEEPLSGLFSIDPDGTVNLGASYHGSVPVRGLTLRQVRKAVQTVLSESLLDPEIFVDVQAYNSKLYYVILDGAGAGQSVYRLPVTGNDTVLDAISQITGLSAVSRKDRIWISR